MARAEPWDSASRAVRRAAALAVASPAAGANPTAAAVAAGTTASPGVATANADPHGRHSTQSAPPPARIERLESMELPDVVPGSLPAPGLTSPPASKASLQAHFKDSVESSSSEEDSLPAGAPAEAYPPAGGPTAAARNASAAVVASIDAQQTGAGALAASPPGGSLGGHAPSSVKSTKSPPWQVRPLRALAKLYKVRLK